MPHTDREERLACQRRHYQNNKADYKQRAKDNSAIAKKRNAQHVLDFLRQNPCCDCGENDPIVLTFDHIEPDQKYKHVSDLVRNSASIKKIDEEIAKCEVRCCNCHARRTAEQQGWFRLLNENEPKAA